MRVHGCQLSRALAHASLVLYQERIKNNRDSLRMTRRTSRLDMPPDPASVVQALRARREAMIGVQTKVRVNTRVYHSASMVVAAIDAMATCSPAILSIFGLGVSR